ncbi:PDR/VanB family oxidoreductase [Tomitella biformata]|uniref:PDR/VanB family oxidoreductase n=1 Tax=Tomitella biformata TaxID=630403 RepID=UPI0004663494|nr:PDR/VanB family oxidoreductase [Tomitella biformata]
MSMQSTTRELLIRQMRWESEDVLSLRLEATGDAALSHWEPGAHLDIHLDQQFGSSLVRQYSLCGDPDEKATYRIAVLRERDGGRGGSRHVHERLRPGQRIQASEPRNNFELLDSPKYLFIAGGIGITPILSMVAEAQRRGADWQLHYGGRTHASMAFLDELRCYGDRVRLVAQDVEGPLDLDRLLGAAAADTLVYTCGPAGLLDAVEERGAGWPDGSIRLERFAPKEAEGRDGAEKSVRVVLEKTGIALTVGPDQSILDALEVSGVDVSNSCREGICGTCETRVLCGTPDHRDSLLSSSEQASGKTMMICVSRALTDELVLDI